MLHFFNIHTAYFLIGLLYVLLPIMSWVVLANQRRKDVVLWCLGGALFGIGAILIALRPVLPPFVSYTLAVALLWYGLALKVDALKLELGDKSSSYPLLLVGFGYLASYEVFRSVWPDPTIRFSAGMLSFIFQSFLIGHLVLTLYKRIRLKSLLWLLFTFVVAAGLNIIKLLLVLLGNTEPDVTSTQMDGLLTVTSGILLAVVGNFAFVGFYLERAVKEQESKLSQQVAQLERQRTIGMMATSFAHELSQPLTSISLDLENIKSQNNAEGIQPHNLNQAIEEMEKTLHHSMDLIARIRHYIRPQVTNHQDTDLVQLLHDVALIVGYEKRKNRITFNYDLPIALHAKCDKVEISQIVLNIYRNAIEAMQSSDKRELSIAVKTVNDQAVIQFKDTGTGIAEVIQPQLGSAFFTTKDQGLGVGLSIYQSIAEKHGGSLTIRNGDDGGALVILKLPLRA